MFDGTVVVMGVSGTGKTEVASRLATRLGRAFIEADRRHSPANLAKMAGGDCLTDADRWPWLAEVAKAVNAEPRPAVVACSALRRAYRDFLRGQFGGTRFVFLDGPSAVIRARMEARPRHFFKAEMLDGQLSALEAPEADEDFVAADIRQTPGEIVEAVVRTLSNAFTAPLSPQR
jgi:gluconokinase